MPLNNDTFANLMEEFSPFEDQPHLAIAVSGGSDSMALTLLAHHWVISRGGRITALVVDHGLRQESRAEANQVCEWLRPLGIEIHVLIWEGEKPQHRIQELARQARYDLLEKWCLDNQVGYLLTAHQGDDQWETLMQRLSRDSGSRGLRGILPERPRPFGRLLRPFLRRGPHDLGILKTEIIAYLETQGQTYINDPSNENNKYERVRWRQERVSWEQKGYTIEKVATIINEAIVSFEALESKYTNWVSENCEVSSLGYLRLNKAEWNTCSPELQNHILSQILSCFQDRPYPTPTPTLHNIRTRLESQSAVGAGGCYFVNRSHEIFVTREVRGLPKIILQSPSSAPVAWDRFLLTFTDDKYDGWIVEPLGQRRAETLCADGGSDEPSYVLASLPCLVNPNNGADSTLIDGDFDRIEGVARELNFFKFVI